MQSAATYRSEAINRLFFLVGLDAPGVQGFRIKTVRKKGISFTATISHADATKLRELRRKLVNDFLTARWRLVGGDLRQHTGTITVFKAFTPLIHVSLGFTAIELRPGIYTFDITVRVG